MNKKTLFLFILCLSAFLQAEGTIFVGIAGGSGSGKTTAAKKIQSAFGSDCVLIEQDCYYKELSHLNLSERGKINFDHPDALDFSLMASHIEDLKQNRSIAKPKYNFHTHTREPDATLIEPAKLVVVEGILLFAVPEFRDLFDFKIYIDTDDDIRIIRRIERDVKDRGRDFESIREQYVTFVKPMHYQFVEQSKKFADVIISGDEDNTKVLDMIISGLSIALQ